MHEKVKIEWRITQKNERNGNGNGGDAKMHLAAA